ncbi:DUF2226 domain-containing protein [Methanobacterium sp. BAmetb5]|uniref:DUF2226 domain-containing protein n=1 Tax=Methanobacterium sp. BAmetb5 TaxID=2025351 RepID=UPI000E875ED8|nr:DUF2226 domain-containing protein [Methanobacterium sp. BAmetb5]AXV40868.1 MAG: hypothetical protein CIT02_11350 [Methanobacterium sp. BAmetb5]
MEMPITKPSLVSYADELDFAKLLEDLANDHKNGFIRITSGSEEGYILYKDGKQVAASFDKFSKVEALEQISSALENKNTVIEVFDVGPSQVDYLLDLNKAFALDADSDIYDVIGELKKTGETEKEAVTEPEVDIPEVEEVKPEKVKTQQVSEDTSSSEEVSQPPVEEKTPDSPLKVDSPGEPEVDKSTVESDQKTPEKDTATDEGPSETKSGESSLSKTSEQPVKEVKKVETSPVTGTASEDKVAETSVDESLPEVTETEEESSKDEPVDRSELLKKYGIKDVQDEDVENLLQNYSGGIIEDDDVERVELVLMNLIKKSVLGIPKIKGTEVMVFLDNYKDLSGTINIITEYENQGIFNRLMGQNRTATNLRRQIINIAEIAIKKSFRQYPEVVDKFEINVEFS